MSHAFAERAFTDAVKARQTIQGSRDGYAQLQGGLEFNHVLGEPERAFIETRDTLFMASVGETGWPYVQHRGGPAGFLRVLDDQTIGFADVRGNRQYVTVGNLAGEDRVALILMDFAHRQRLKLLGHARTIERADDPALVDRLMVPGWRARPERAVLISVAGFDWNCPQHITPRFTAEEVRAATAPLRERIATLESALRAAGMPVPD